MFSHKHSYIYIIKSFYLYFKIRPKVVVTTGAHTAVYMCYIAKLFGWLKKPNDKQDKLLKDHEELLKKHAELLEKDNKRLFDLEEQDRLVLQSLFALLSHGIDGNDVEAMKKCKDNIQDYLILK